MRKNHLITLSLIAASDAFAPTGSTSTRSLKKAAIFREMCPGGKSNEDRDSTTRTVLYKYRYPYQYTAKRRIEYNFNVQYLNTSTR